MARSTAPFGTSLLSPVHDTQSRCRTKLGGGRAPVAVTGYESTESGWVAPPGPTTPHPSSSSWRRIHVTRVVTVPCPPVRRGVACDRQTRESPSRPEHAWYDSPNRTRVRQPSHACLRAFRAAHSVAVYRTRVATVRVRARTRATRRGRGSLTTRISESNLTRTVVGALCSA